MIDYNKNYKRTIFTWSLYDFANQPFPTIIITFMCVMLSQAISAKEMDVIEYDSPVPRLQDFGRGGTSR